MLVCRKVESTTNSEDPAKPSGNPPKLRGGKWVMEINLFDLQLLLAIQSLEPNAYNVSILDTVNKHTRRLHWPGRAYAALDRLEQEGLVRKTRERRPTPKRGGRRKLIMHLTPTGRSTLAGSLNGLDSLRGMRSQSQDAS
jgi:DNA-binding PadR family transcriptional regulator